MPPRKKKTKRTKISAASKTTRRTTSIVIDKKISQESSSTFATFAKNEPKVAAYLGYSDLCEFRKFRFCGPVLHWYTVFGKNINNRPSSHAFQLLCDLSVISDKFGSDAETLLQKYPVVPNTTNRVERQQNKSNYDYIYAGIIFHLANDIEKVNTDGTLLIQARDQDAVKAFEEMVQVTIPLFEPHSIVPPVLGPRADLEEDVMEKYSRAYTVLKSLQTITAQSKWIASFASKPDPFQSVKIGSDVLPTWMQPQTAEEQANVLLQEKSPLATKTFTMQFDRSVKSKFEADLCEHEESHIIYNSLIMPPASVKPNRDPRLYPVGSMWRDTLRYQLNFAALQIDFLRISVKCALTPGTAASIPVRSIVVFDSVNMGAASPWTDVQAFLKTPEIISFVFTYTLRVVEAEEDDYEYEYEGPPLGVHDVIQITPDDDIGPRGVVQSTAEAQSSISGPPPADENAQDDEAVRRLEKFLSTGGISAKKHVITVDSLFKAGKDAECLTYHSGYNVRSPQGLLDWQHWVIDQICGNMPKPTKEKSLLRLPKKLQIELQDIRTDTTLAVQNIDPDIISTMRRFYDVQQAFTGTADQTGPLLELSKIVMGAEFVTKHGQAKILNRYTCSVVPGCAISFLDSQINGAVFMLQRSCGKIPLSTPLAHDKPAIAAAKNLESIQTYGGFLVDMMGMGKTYTALLFLNYYALYHRPQAHRPHLIVTPSGIVLDQWLEAIHTLFPGLTVILAHGERPSSVKYAQNWISATAMREAPASLKNFPAHLKYIFTATDSRSSKVVVLTSYETLGRRTLASTKTFNDKGEEIQVFHSRWEGIFEVVLLDEGHKLRHTWTRLYAGVKELKANVHWFLTGTPIQNDAKDVLGPLQILWTKAEKTILEVPERLKWLEENANNSFECFPTANSLGATAWQRLIIMDPIRMKALLRTDNLATILDHYHHMDQLLMIRRSPASTLLVNSKGDSISMRSIMPLHEVKTVQLKYAPEEEVEHQWVHRQHARTYAEAMKEWSAERDSTGVKSSFPPIVAPLRYLTVASSSVLLDRFERTLRHAGRTGLVEDMSLLRDKGFNAFNIIPLVKRDGDGDITTGLECLRFLTYGSPKLRYILYQIHSYVLPNTTAGKYRKLLLTEDIPLSAHFWEMVCNLTYVETAVLHSGLSDQERVDLIRRFNDPKSTLLILCIMYNVNAQGANLDTCCSRVLVVTAAINAPLEVQAYSRVIRVSQKELVSITRLVTQNSHDQFRESKQIDKSVVDLATRAFSKEVRNLLVKILNEANEQVREAHESPLGKALLDGRETLPFELSIGSMDLDDNGSDLDFTVPRDLPPRRRQEPDRFSISMLAGSSLYASYGKKRGRRAAADSEESTSETDDQGSNYTKDGDSSDDDDASDREREDDGESAPVFSNQTVIQRARHEYRKLVTKEQEMFDQEELNLRLLLQLSPEYKYTTEDLRNHNVLDRALRLLLSQRSGQDMYSMRVGPHIKYNKLPSRVVKTIQGKLQVQKEGVVSLVKFLTPSSTALNDKPDDTLGGSADKGDKERSGGNDNSGNAKPLGDEANLGNQNKPAIDSGILVDDDL